jgi:hypothetical protein
MENLNTEEPKQSPKQIALAERTEGITIPNNIKITKASRGWYPRPS